MGLHWALHCVAVAALLGLAARIAESVLHGAGRPARWVWASALIGSLFLPLAAWRGWIVGAGFFGRPGWVPWSVGSGESGAITALPERTPFVLPQETISTSPDWFALLSGRVLLVAWALSSLVMILILLRSALSLRRVRREWRPDLVEGVSVLVSTEIGPAALGLVRGAIVVPEWVFTLEDRFQRLLLLHELEHLRAGDPRLLMASILAVAIMPWNPLLWWQFRRLREALEVDCDLRVLRADPDARGYGLLLLEVGRRPAEGGPALAGLTGLAGRESFLERRIRILGRNAGPRHPSPGLARARLLGGVMAAVLLVILACDLREPMALDEVTMDPAASASSATNAPDGVGALDATGASPARVPLKLSNLAERPEIRGAADDSCSPLYILDGVIVAAPAGEGPILSRLTTESIEQIEVIKGRAAAQTLPDLPSAAAECGVIRITTKARATTTDAGLG